MRLLEFIMRTLVLKKINKVKMKKVKMKKDIIEKLKETLNLCRKIQENEGSKVKDTKLISEIKKDVDSLSEYINDISISNRKKD